MSLLDSTMNVVGIDSLCCFVCLVLVFYWVGFVSLLVFCSIVFYISFCFSHASTFCFHGSVFLYTDVCDRCACWFACIVVEALFLLFFCVCVCTVQCGPLTFVFTCWCRGLLTPPLMTSFSFHSIPDTMETNQIHLHVLLVTQQNIA